MTTRRTGLREQKKQATRDALSAAALRLALAHGPDQVRVDDIAEAAGVAPRTYNNYFASREQAIVAAISAGREARVAATVAGRPAGVPLSEAITDAVVTEYTETADDRREALLMITTRPALRQAYLDTAAAIESPLTGVLRDRLGDGATARVLAASVAAAVRVALDRWARPADGAAAGGLVLVRGSLPDELRAALAPLAPALDAASG
ncbi:TetR family transcriptional regulator [Actinocatenispora thailandica]|uniref:TetR family transcriptional regulator n=1 Tax=Actinocatenispora thailandica TaxID=227318 RepID=A0A7R7HYZ6_9ACTN|nr:TetR/AcrR family transcriptional regulator [Actinocatenispora thailandica]BCJ36608.1 TetR family transcriptional regulator [Actinocatenispora thailandica]